MGKVHDSGFNPLIFPNKPIQWKLHKNIKLADGDRQTALILMLRLLALLVKCLLCAARNRPPLSLSKLIKNMENKEGKIAVVVGGRGWERWERRERCAQHPWITGMMRHDEAQWGPSGFRFSMILADGWWMMSHYCTIPPFEDVNVRQGDGRQARLRCAGAEGHDGNGGEVILRQWSLGWWQKQWETVGRWGSASKGVSEKVTRHCFSDLDCVEPQVCALGFTETARARRQPVFPARFNIFHMNFPWIVIIFLLHSPTNEVLQGFFLPLLMCSIFDVVPRMCPLVFNHDQRYVLWPDCPNALS